jgi:small-conductance mechanosensitive channel
VAVRELLLDFFPIAPTSDASAVALIVVLLAGLLLGSLLRRLREALPTAGALPRTLAITHGALRLAILVVFLALLTRLLPAWMSPALPWMVLAAAAALGWSARDVLPDAVAGVVLAFERRIRRGVWLSGEGFAGTVEGLGIRATTLRDARGHRVSIPNRRLLSAPVVSDTSVGSEHEVTLRIPMEQPAARIRRALHDAVLLSPWVPPDARPVVLRDPDEPALWHVRSSLLEIRFAARFEGELLERAEEILAHEATAPGAEGAWSEPGKLAEPESAPT